MQSENKDITVSEGPKDSEKKHTGTGQISKPKPASHKKQSSSIYGDLIKDLEI